MPIIPPEDPIEGMPINDYNPNDWRLDPSITAPPEGQRAEWRPPVQAPDDGILRDSGGNPFEKVITDQKPMEDIQDKLLKAAGPDGFTSPIEYRRALINGLREVARERGNDVNGDHADWYTNQLQIGTSPGIMSQFMAQPTDPKDIFETKGGDLYDRKKKAFVYKKPDGLRDLLDNHDALHETASNIAQRNKDLADQGIKPISIPPPELSFNPSQAASNPDPGIIKPGTNIDPRFDQTPTTQDVSNTTSDDPTSKIMEALDKADPTDREKVFAQHPSIAKEYNRYLKQKDDVLKEGDKKGQAYDKTFQSLVSKQPDDASSRTLLGTVMAIDRKVNNANALLVKPIITTQDMSQITGELAGIIQGGSPHENELKEQGYGTLRSKAASVLQMISGIPANAVTPEIKARIQDVLNDFSRQNQKAIARHFKGIEVANPEAIARDKEAWENYKENWGVDYSVLNEKGKGSPEAPSAQTQTPPPVITSQAQFDKLPQGAVYISSNGKQHTKPLKP